MRNLKPAKSKIHDCALPAALEELFPGQFENGKRGFEEDHVAVHEKEVPELSGGKYTTFTWFRRFSGLSQRALRTTQSKKSRTESTSSPKKRLFLGDSGRENARKTENRPRSRGYGCKYYLIRVEEIKRLKHIRFAKKIDQRAKSLKWRHLKTENGGDENLGFFEVFHVWPDELGVKRAEIATLNASRTVDISATNFARFWVRARLEWA